MSGKRVRLGLALRGFGDPVSLLPLCRRAEQLGFSRLWFVEVNDVDVFAMSAAAAGKTQSIGVASGVANSYLRLPTLTAMSAATVSALSGGRFTLGIGAGSPPLTRFNQQWETPLRRFKETLEIVTQLLRSGRVVYHGRIFETRGFELGFKPPRTPVYAAGMGIRTLRLAAKVADGALLMFPTLNHVKEALSVIRDVVGKRGIPLDKFGVASYMVTVCSDDLEIALKEARRVVAAYAAIPVYRRNFERLGYSREIGEVAQSLSEGFEVAAERVPDRMVEDFIVHGNAEECAESIEKFVEAGVTEPVVYPYSSRREGYHAMLAGIIEALGRLNAYSE
jgi:alkanesulfonate monooxygenase SsuD/methylene tetrahydromethanopterin reductase-like flavin-dependent oxidoreductase (luciferase family)